MHILIVVYVLILISIYISILNDEIILLGKKANNYFKQNNDTNYNNNKNNITESTYNSIEYKKYDTIISYIYKNSSNMNYTSSEDHTKNYNYYNYIRQKEKQALIKKSFN